MNRECMQILPLTGLRRPFACLSGNMGRGPATVRRISA